MSSLPQNGHATRSVVTLEADRLVGSEPDADVQHGSRNREVLMRQRNHAADRCGARKDVQPKGLALPQLLVHVVPLSVDTPEQRVTFEQRVDAAIWWTVDYHLDAAMLRALPW